MSWSVIEAILGRASIDPAFCRELLQNPLGTVQKYGFSITPEEQAVLREVHAHDLSEFSRLLLVRLPYDKS